MSAEALQPFFQGVAVVSALLAAASLLTISRRGARAWLMAIAFLALGGTSMLFVRRAPESWIVLGFAVTLAVLAAEFLMRARGRRSEGPPR